MLRARLSVPRRVKPGEPVRIAYEIASSTPEVATVETGRENCRLFKVERRGADGYWREIWDNFAERRASARAQGIVLVCLDSAVRREITQSRPYRVEVTWRQTDADGRPAPAGTYRAVSATGTSAPELPNPAPVSFEIGP